MVNNRPRREKIEASEKYLKTDIYQNPDPKRAPGDRPTLSPPTVARRGVCMQTCPSTTPWLRRLGALFAMARIKRSR